jgi:alanine transaminase
MEVNPRVKKAEYAVRGRVVARAQEIEEELKRGSSTRKFDKIIYCNIGNPHALGQKPVTFIRQVLAACVCPSLMDAGILPTDVVVRAKEYLAGTGGSGVGAYTETAGLAVVRRQVAEFMERRDGVKADAKRIILTNGASDAIRRVIQLILHDDVSMDGGVERGHERQGIMIPCPQYPLYSCQIVLSGGSIVYYESDEAREWGVTRAELERSFLEATGSGVVVKALVVINPGNPTGAVLSESDIEEIVRFAEERKLVILADEVYQENVYVEGKKFESFKKVVAKLQSKALLFSFHSTSKGLLGECGIRAGYVEAVNVPDDVFKELIKLSASQLSSNTLGQIACGLMCSPPRQGDTSFDLYHRETQDIFESLKRRAAKLSRKMQSIHGFSFPSPIQGAMYAFPSIKLPAKAVEEAEKRKMAPDEFYCMELLENTGIVCVPGSGFGQRKDTYHFRTTILPPESDIDNLTYLLADFHTNWTQQFQH